MNWNNNGIEFYKIYEDLFFLIYMTDFVPLQITRDQLPGPIRTALLIKKN